MAQKPVEFHEEATAEAEAAVTWYRERSPRAAQKFVEELDAAIQAIQQQPDQWGAFSHGTRRFLLRRFPYYVVYRETDSEIDVVAVAHAKRKPGYWKTRGANH